jgi:sugar phosphate isomerase/epimerase
MPNPPPAAAPWNVSLFTACAPWLPLVELAPVCVAAGVLGLDLAVKPHAPDPSKPRNFWDNNAAVIPLQTLDASVRAAAEVLRRHGLSCRMLCSYLQPGDLADARRLASAAKVLGAPMVRIWSPRPEAGQARDQVRAARTSWSELAAIGADHGVRFVLELHDHTITSSVSAALRLLDGLPPEQVGVILDVANIAIQGNEPLALGIDLLGPYLAHVHVKDVVFRQGPGWNGQESVFVPLGQGTIRWPLCLKLLRESGYGGWLALENFTEVERGPPRIASDMAWLQGAIRESQHA